MSDSHGQQCLTERQRMALGRPLDKDRVASRRGDGKNLSYLEAWDVKAHLTRIFGYCGWDSILADYRGVFERGYDRVERNKDGSPTGETTPMIEIAYSAKVQLSVRCEHGVVIATHCEAAVGQANVTQTNASRGDAHDNALKQAESDALKRCAINLGTQFGLSLYNNGSLSDVVGRTLMDADLLHTPTPDQQAALESSLNVTPVEGGETADKDAVR
jgi:recombination DNA repair RAD52 pathway protein